VHCVGRFVNMFARLCVRVRHSFEAPVYISEQNIYDADLSAHTIVGKETYYKSEFAGKHP
jgi:hypothetical protein